MSAIRVARFPAIGALFLMACALGGCGGKQEAGTQSTTIQVKGSDTMVNVAQAWAEEYKTVAPIPYREFRQLLQEKKIKEVVVGLLRP